MLFQRGTNRRPWARASLHRPYVNGMLACIRVTVFIIIPQKTSSDGWGHNMNTEYIVCKCIRIETLKLMTWTLLFIGYIRIWYDAKNITSSIGVAMIWCEKGHETKRKWLKGDTQKYEIRAINSDIKAIGRSLSWMSEFVQLWSDQKTKKSWKSRRGKCSSAP